MSDEIAVGLREIAALLQARIDQTAEMEKRGEERMARFEMPRPEVPDFAAMEAKHEAKDHERQARAAQLRAEDVEFRDRLLAALERQNALLARLVDRFAPE